MVLRIWTKKAPYKNFLFSISRLSKTPKNTLLAATPSSLTPKPSLTLSIGSWQLLLLPLTVSLFPLSHPNSALLFSLSVLLFLFFCFCFFYYFFSWCPLPKVSIFYLQFSMPCLFPMWGSCLHRILLVCLCNPYIRVSLVLIGLDL